MQSEAADGGDRQKVVTLLGPASGRQVQAGQVVRSVQGRDRNRWYVVVDQDKAGFIYVSDGDRRPLARPKRKNPRHLLVYDRVISGIAGLSVGGRRGIDPDLKQALEEIADSFNDGEEVDDAGQARRD